MDACQDGGEDCLFDEEREEGRGMSAEERGILMTGREGRGVGWVCWGLLLKLIYVDNL